MLAGRVEGVSNRCWVDWRERCVRRRVSGSLRGVDMFVAGCQMVGMRNYSQCREMSEARML